MRLIEIENITAAYDNQIVLESASLTIDSNSFIGVIGPNGGGKTTFIKCLMKLLLPIKGTINYCDKNLRIGYLPQQATIDKQFPINVLDTICSGSMQSKRTIISDVQRIISEIGIAHLMNRAIGELSGGELQRVLLARALVRNPHLLVLDEPTTYVDNKFEKEFYQILHKLNETVGIIMVSHDLNKITQHAKTIACINRSFHYHPSNKINKDELRSYNCPIQLLSNTH